MKKWKNIFSFRLSRYLIHAKEFHRKIYYHGKNRFAGTVKNLARSAILLSTGEQEKKFAVPGKNLAALAIFLRWRIGSSERTSLRQKMILLTSQCFCWGSYFFSLCYFFWFPTVFCFCFFFSLNIRNSGILLIFITNCKHIILPMPKSFFFLETSPICINNVHFVDLTFLARVLIIPALSALFPIVYLTFPKPTNN